MTSSPLDTKRGPTRIEHHRDSSIEIITIDIEVALPGAECTVHRPALHIISYWSFTIRHRRVCLRVEVESNDNATENDKRED